MILFSRLIFQLVYSQCIGILLILCVYLHFVFNRGSHCAYVNNWCSLWKEEPFCGVWILLDLACSWRYIIPYTYPFLLEESFRKENHPRLYGFMTRIILDFVGVVSFVAPNRTHSSVFIMEMFFQLWCPAPCTGPAELSLRWHSKGIILSHKVTGTKKNMATGLAV